MSSVRVFILPLLFCLCFFSILAYSVVSPHKRLMPPYISPIRSPRLPYPRLLKAAGAASVGGRGTADLLFPDAVSGRDGDAGVVQRLPPTVFEQYAHHRRRQLRHFLLGGVPHFCCFGTYGSRNGHYRWRGNMASRPFSLLLDKIIIFVA